MRKLEITTKKITGTDGAITKVWKLDHIHVAMKWLQAGRGKIISKEYIVECPDCGTRTTTNNFVAFCPECNKEIEYEAPSHN